LSRTARLTRTTSSRGEPRVDDRLQKLRESARRHDDVERALRDVTPFTLEHLDELVGEPLRRLVRGRRKHVENARQVDWAVHTAARITVEA
jgi:hypothetical protein